MLRGHHLPGCVHAGTAPGTVLAMTDDPGWWSGAAEHVDVRGPRAVVCGPQALRNIDAWAARAEAAGKAVRPHLKGHKVPELFAHQLTSAVGVEISKLSELLLWVERGVDTDYVYSWCWPDRPAIWEACARLAADGVTLTVDVDSPDLVDAYATAARAAGSTLGVRIQVDSGLRGVDPSKAVALARQVIGTPGLELRGLTAYRSIYRRDISRDPRPLDVLGRTEGELLAGLLHDLDAAGDLTVLCGSTATSWGAATVPEVTELAGASYVLGDWGLAQMGVVAVRDVAVGVVAVVTAAGDGHVTVDVGEDDLGDDGPYPGHVGGVLASTPRGDVEFTEATETTASGTVVEGPGPDVGDHVVLLPAQASAVARLPGVFVAVDDDGCPVDRWARVASVVTEADPII